jgi:hypothetical protein
LERGCRGKSPATQSGEREGRLESHQGRESQHLGKRAIIRERNIII